MYGLRTALHFFHGFWESSISRYFVGVICLPVNVVLVWVDRSLLCVIVVGLWRAWSSLCSCSVCVVSSVMELLHVVCLYLSTYFTVTNGFVPFRLPLVDALSVSFTGGRREVFLFLGLAGNFSSFYNGFLSLDPNQLD